MNSTSMNSIQEFVTYEALSLEVGNSIRMVCPVCSARHEKSFQITRTQSNLLYPCYLVLIPDYGLFVPAYPTCGVR